MVKKTKQVEEIEIEEFDESDELAELEAELEEEIEEEEIEEEAPKPKAKPKKKKAPAKPKVPAITVNDLKVGSILKDHKGNDVEITKTLVDQMREYEQGNPKSHAVWKNKITGTFLYFKFYKENPAPKKTPKKVIEEEIEEPEEVLTDEEIDAEIEAEELEEVVDEENLLKDAMADYKTIKKIKGKVNPKTKAFKAFFEEFKKSE